MARPTPLISFFAALVLAFCGLTAAAAPAAASTAVEAVAYVAAASGDDAASGTDPSQPVRTLERALALVAEQGGRVVLMDDYPLDATINEPAHTEPILVTSQYGDQTYPGRLVFGNTAFLEYNLAGPTTFADLGIVTSQWAVFAANFHPIVFGDGVTMLSTPQAGVRQVFIVGGYHGPSADDTILDADSHITVNSGTFYKIAGFSRGKGAGTQTYTGTSHITINDAVVQEVYGAALENHYSGSTEITMTGGRIGTLHTGGDVTRYLVGSATLNLTGGHINTIDINNVVEDVDLTLNGVDWDAITAANAWGGEERHDQILAFAPVRTVHFAGQHHTPQQVEALRSIFDVLDNTADVRVSAGGSGTECSAEAPCGSLETALGLLAADGGAITISGSVPWDVDPATLAAGTGRVTFVGDGTTASIAFPADSHVVLARDVTFSSLALANAGPLGLLADGKDLTIGDGVTVAEGSDAYVAGQSDGASLTVRSGEFAHVIGVTGLTSDFTGSTDVTIAGGEVDHVWAGTDQQYAVAGARVTISGGEVGTLTASALNVTGSLTARLITGEIGDVELAGADAAVLLRVGAAEIKSISVEDWSDPGSAQRVLTRLPGADQAVIDQVSSAFSTVREDEVVYVGAGGTGDGSSPAHAVGDLRQAIDALSGDGRVVLTDRYTVDGYDLGSYDAQVLLTSHDGDIDFSADGAALQVEGPLRLGGPTTVDNLLLQSPTINGAIYAMGHPLTIGEGVSTEFTRRGETLLTIVGGRDDTAATASTSVSVKGGEWASLRGGSDNIEASSEGSQITVQIDGGTFQGPVVLAHRGTGSGDVSATITGGEFTQGVYAVYEEDGSAYAADYAVDLTVTGGEFWATIAPAKSRSTVLAGTFDLTVSGGGFAHLTDLLGSEGFAGTMTSTLTVDPALDIQAAPTGELTFTNPLVRAADPYMFVHDGQYYFISTGGATLSLYKVANPADLSQAVGSVIFAPDDMANLWSPEIHHLSAEEVGEQDAGWYLYLSAAQLGEGAAEGQRQYVLKALDGDDLFGRWGDPVTGEVDVARRITNVDHADFNAESFVAGISLMRVADETYITYVAEVGRSTSDFHQTINMSHMVNPWTLSGDPSVITRSEYDWEEQGYAQSTSDPNMWWPKVVEGATAVYGRDGEVYMAYSASGYWTVHYAIGYLKYVGGDPMDAANWVKNPTPIMSKNGEVTGTGTGPNFADHEGTDWFMYQARPGTSTTTARYAFIEPYVADQNGLQIGDGSGHPAPLTTEYSMSVNPIPLAEKISGFEN